MVSEAGDVQSFLVQHPPFNQLSENQLEFASANIYVAFSKPGNELQLNKSTLDGPKTGMLIVRSGSLEIRDQQGVLIDRLSSGDYLVPGVLYSDTRNIPRIVVLEDCLYYELGDKAFQSLTATSSEMAAICETDKTHTVYSDDTGDDGSYQADDEVERKDVYLGQYVKDTMSSVIIFAAPDTSIREAAQLMREHHISSLLVKDKAQLVGIVTDRDFRIRVLEL